MTESPDYEVYKDDETGLYVAEHPTLPVSSCGETTDEALKNAQEAVRLYDEPEGNATPEFDLDRVTDSDDVQEMMQGSYEESEDRQVRTIVADAIGDPRYCPECGSELDIEWEGNERGDRRCPDCGRRHKEYTIEYLKEIVDPEDVEESEIEVVRSDTVEADEDIDIYHPDTNLRIERLSDESVYVAGYSGGDSGNIDRRYWFTIEDGKLEIGREITRKND